MSNSFASYNSCTSVETHPFIHKFVKHRSTASLKPYIDLLTIVPHTGTYKIARYNPLYLAQTTGFRGMRRGLCACTEIHMLAASADYMRTYNNKWAA